MCDAGANRPLKDPSVDQGSLKSTLRPYYPCISARNTAGEAIAAGFSGRIHKRNTAVGAPVPLSDANAAIMDHSGLVMSFQTDPLVPRQKDSPPDQETKDLPDSLMPRERRNNNAQKIASEAQAKIVSAPHPYILRG